MPKTPLDVDNKVAMFEKASRAEAEAAHQQRIAQFYHQQRLDAERKAMSGDANARAMVGKIGSKLQHGGSDKNTQQIAQNDLSLARTGHGIDFSTRKGRTTGDAATPAPVQNDPVTFLADPMLALGRKLLASGVGKVASHVFPVVEDEVSGIARHFFPRADHPIEPAVPRARVVGKAHVEDVPRKAIGTQKALPKRASAPKISKPAQKGAIQRSGEAKVKRQTAVARGAIRSRQARGDNAIPARPAPAQQALPAPKSKLGADFKQPKSVKASTPRAKQTSARAKGTNPRQQPGYKRKSKQGAA